MSNFNCSDLIEKTKSSNSPSCRTVEEYCRNVNNNPLRMEDCRERGLECLANRQCAEINQEQPCNDTKNGKTIRVDKNFFRKNPQPGCSQGHRWKFENLNKN